MIIKTKALGHIGANCYVLESLESVVVIDTGKYDKEILQALNTEKEVLILLTHCHFDHIGGAQRLREESGAKIAIGEGDFLSTLDGAKTMSDVFRANVLPFKADIALKDNQIITVGDIEIKCIETPGHTKGGMCYLIDGKLFSGDTLFKDSIGRTDFIDGSFVELSSSIKKLYDLLPDETIVYPGHGEPTSIGREKLSNPFVRDI